MSEIEKAFTKLQNCVLVSFELQGKKAIPILEKLRKTLLCFNNTPLRKML